jgi:cytochrome c-type protein NapC
MPVAASAPTVSGLARELLHKTLDSRNTPEKFEVKRLKLARHVWASMKRTDSCECRNCHKGIAHSLPAMYEMDPNVVVGYKGAE